MPFFYQPHMVCYGGDIKLITIMAIADTSIALAYFGISAIIFYLLRSQPKPIQRLALSFAAFILLCGLGHLGHMIAIFYVQANLLWWIACEFALTGVVSLVTCFKLWIRVPEIRALSTRLSNTTPAAPPSATHAILGQLERMDVIAESILTARGAA